MKYRLLSTQIQPSSVLTRSSQVTSPGLAPLPSPGDDAPSPSVDVFIFDDSYSVMGHGGADPIDRRYEEARFALRSVARHCRTSKAMAAVWHFDQPSSGDSPVLPLKQWRNLQDFEASLRVPIGSHGSSSLGPALERATQLASAMASHEIRLTILSDFWLTDHNPAQIWAQLEHFPGSVHAVVLGTDDAPEELRDLGLTISRIAPGDEPGVVAATLHHSLTEGRPGRQIAHRLLRITEPASLAINN